MLVVGVVEGDVGAGVIKSQSYKATFERDLNNSIQITQTSRQFRTLQHLLITLI